MTIETQTCSARELGTLLGVSARRVRQLHEEGVFPRAGRGQYPLAECVRAYIAQIERLADPAELKRERTRLLKEQADRLERENRLSRHDLCRTDAVIGVMTAQSSAVRDQLMSVPARRSHEIAAELGVGVAEVSALLERVIRGELTAAGEVATMAYDQFVSQHGSLHP